MTIQDYYTTVMLAICNIHRSAYPNDIQDYLLSVLRAERSRIIATC